MSVYIKGFPMPNNCGACPLRLAWCRERIYMVTRPERCPLIPVPEHGDLIEEGDVLAIVSEYCPDDDGSVGKVTDLREMLDEIEGLPTIIPASGGKENEYGR